MCFVQSKWLSLLSKKMAKSTPSPASGFLFARWNAPLVVYSPSAATSNPSAAAHWEVPMTCPVSLIQR